ncbi:hypothetical protein HY633_01170 [Candidatus Uhrbacteria bacterium]|nr:hypothetical protein [Candidatus Uhrbacteria bacterium]
MRASLTKERAMTPEEFKSLEKTAENLLSPLNERIGQVRNELAMLELEAERHERFKAWHRLLMQGESTAGFFSASYAMYVRRYRAESAKKNGLKATLLDVDLVIVPDALTPHDLRVDVPHADGAGMTNTSREVDVSGIVDRMLAYTRHAKNVSVGTLDDVLREPCRTCGEAALVAASDAYLDEDNGREFIIGRLCAKCPSVEEFAVFSEYAARHPQFGRTYGIYRRE